MFRIRSSRLLAVLSALAMAVAGASVPATSAPISYLDTGGQAILPTINEVIELDQSSDGSRILVLSATPDGSSGALRIVSGGSATVVSTDVFRHAEITDSGNLVIASTMAGTLYSFDVSNLDSIPSPADITPSLDLDADQSPDVTSVGEFALSGDGLTITAVDMPVTPSIPNWIRATRADTSSSWTWTQTGTQVSLPKNETVDGFQTDEAVTSFAASQNGATVYAGTNFGRILQGQIGASFTWAELSAPRNQSGGTQVEVSADGATALYATYTWSAISLTKAVYTKDAKATTPTWTAIPMSDLDLGVNSDFQRQALRPRLSSDGKVAVFAFTNGNLVFSKNFDSVSPTWDLVGTALGDATDFVLSGTGATATLASDADPDSQASPNGVLHSQALTTNSITGAWYPAKFPNDTEQSIYILDGETSDFVPSHIMVTDQTNFAQHLCDNSLDEYGSNADVLGAAGSNPCGETALLDINNLLSGRLLLEPCPADSSNLSYDFCIEDISIGSSTLTSATHMRNTAGPEFSANTELGAEAGGTVSLWSSSHNHSAGAGTYAANVAVFVRAKFNADRTAFLGVEYSGISATVTPYVEVPNYGSLGVGDLVVDENSNQSPQVVSWSGGDGPRCAYAEAGVCGRIVDFSAGTKISMTVRVPKTVGGFYKGRLKDPSITVAALDGFPDAQKITVAAEYVSVPRLEHTIDATDSSILTEVVTDGQTTQQLFQLDMDGDSAIDSRLRTGTPASQDTAFKLVEWLKRPAYANDRASGFNTLWSFGTLGSQFDSPVDNEVCLADTTKVLGVVTSNSMVYQDSPPAVGVDSSGNPTLTYKVGGVHLPPTGSTPIEGTYDMLIDSTVARCLNPSLASVPVGDLAATVSISEGVTDKPATTVSVAEADNWLKVSAYGFTFSTNEVQVALAVPAATPITSAPAILPVTTAPEPVTPPTIPAGTTGAVLIGGQPANVTIAPSSTKGSLEIKGTDWSLDISPSTSSDALNANGELVLNPQLTPDVSGSGFQANSKASAYLIPSSATQVAALGITQAGLRAMTTGTIDLGEIPVSATGTFTANLDLRAATPGGYVLQINGAAPDGKIRSISIKANIPDTALKGWTKKISENQVKVYVKNVVRAGKVQIFVNGEEIAWINAGDETDRKLRFAQGFNYLVRTVTLEPGKNRIEIRLDGERIRFNTYSLG